MKKAAVILVAITILQGCQLGNESRKGHEMPPGLDVKNMDQGVNLKDDFYQFANGNWLKTTEIPADEGRWGGFNELREKTNLMVKDIMKSVVNDPDLKEGSDEHKAVVFYQTGMDSTLAEENGIEPIAPWIEKIDATTDKGALVALLPDLHKSGYNPFHGIFIIPHLMDSKTNALYFGSDGLGLPNRDYYTKEDSTSVDIREKYVVHIARMFSLVSPGSDNEARAARIMEIENQLALVTLTPIEQRNIPALYNPMTIADLQKTSPEVDWATYLEQTGIATAEIDTLIVTEPKFMEGLSNVLATTSLEDLKDYVKWNVINRSANYLNDEIVQANFDFYGKVVRGTEEIRPRWERVLGTTNGVIGEAIGKVYVNEVFPPEAKQKAEQLVANLIRAFETRIDNLPWMSDETKVQAVKKLHALRVKIGYPDEWKNYGDLTVGSDSYMANLEQASRWVFDEDVKKIGEPVDKNEWQMNPQTVNAYFHPLNNEIVFPAAILQPPFYNYTADAAVNYGGIGAVIGHEISHGFDDQGSRFDADGNMVNWWTEEDRTSFEERTTQLVAQYDAYEPLEGVNVQGKLTLGENIGDLGGLNAAYDALQMHLAESERPADIDGFNPEQRFFLSWATVWRTKYRDESLRNQILSDPHSPGMIRGIAPLVNMETFFKAFDIKEGDGLWVDEADRVIVW